MEELADVAFVLNCEGIEDSIKMAAVTDCIMSIDSLDSDEEKKAALEEFESFLKEAGLWASLSPFLQRWGKRFGSNRFGEWLQRMGNTGITRAAGSAGTALVPATGAIMPGVSRSVGKSRLFDWMARHPTAAKLGLGGTVAGGSLLGGSIYGGMKSNEAYKKGYGTAVGQLSPMVSALHAPQGAINYRR